MAILINKIVEAWLQFSPLAAECFDHVPRWRLSALAKQMPRKPPVVLPGVKRPAGYAAFFLQAVALGKHALELAAEHRDIVIPVLFRDSDGTCTDERRRWENIVASITEGLQASGCPAGVAMVPKPKQEAWLLCAFKGTPYQNCPEIEDESGNDASPNSLKKQLDDCFHDEFTTEELCDLIANDFEHERMDMPSFAQFLAHLRRACDVAQGRRED